MSLSTLIGYYKFLVSGRLTLRYLLIISNRRIEKRKRRPPCLTKTFVPQPFAIVRGRRAIEGVGLPANQSILPIRPGRQCLGRSIRLAIQGDEEGFVMYDDKLIRLMRAGSRVEGYVVRERSNKRHYQQ